jgi:predicted secreted protein
MIALDFDFSRPTARDFLNQYAKLARNAMGRDERMAARMILASVYLDGRLLYDYSASDIALMVLGSGIRQTGTGEIYRTESEDAPPFRTPPLVRENIREIFFTRGEFAPLSWIIEVIQKKSPGALDIAKKALQHP